MYLFKDLFRFVVSQLIRFFSLGVFLLILVPLAYGISYFPSFWLISLVYQWGVISDGVWMYIALVPFFLSLSIFYAFLTLKVFRIIRDVDSPDGTDRHDDENNPVKVKFQFTRCAFLMAMTCNLSLGLLFFSVLLSMGAEECVRMLTGDIDGIQLSGFRAMYVFVGAATIYTLGHAAIKLFFLPAIFFLAEKRGNLSEALQFSWQTITVKPFSLYCGILLIEMPFLFGFILIEGVLFIHGALFFSYVTSSLFLTPLINAYIFILYAKAEKSVAPIGLSMAWRWQCACFVLALLLCAPLGIRYYQETRSATMKHEVTRYLNEKQYDQAWTTAMAIPFVNIREDVQFDVVDALIEAKHFDRAVYCANQMYIDPWRHSYRTTGHYMFIIDCLVVAEEFELARSFAEPRFPADDDVFEKINDAEKRIPILTPAQDKIDNPKE